MVKSVPQLTYYRERVGDVANYPNAAAIAKGSIAFPVGPHLNLADMRTIEAALKRVLIKAMG